MMPRMPQRATKRGQERTPLDRDCDVLICGASFGGLSVARELASAGAEVLVVDRYEIGERQTSACGIPTDWLYALDLQDSLQQTFAQLVIHTPHATARFDLPWTFSTFDYRALCGLLADQGSFEFETATVNGRTGHTVHTDRGDIRSPLIVDALGWRRVLGAGANVQPPEALLSRGLEVHPFGTGEDLEVWIDRSYVPAGYGWSFPADGELRIGVGSFDPRFHVREPTERLARDLDAERARCARSSASGSSTGRSPTTSRSLTRTSPGPAARVRSRPASRRNSSSCASCRWRAAPRGSGRRGGTGARRLRRGCGGRRRRTTGRRGSLHGDRCRAPTARSTAAGPAATSRRTRPGPVSPSADSRRRRCSTPPGGSSGRRGCSRSRPPLPIPRSPGRSP